MISKEGPLRGASRPSIEAQMKFEVLMQIFDKGPSLDTKARGDIIGRFLAISEPGVEKEIKWNPLSKAPHTKEIVNIVCWGLREFREGRPFMRQGPPKSRLVAPLFASQVDRFSDGIQWDRSNRRVVRVGSVTLQHQFLTRVFELLTEVAPWLRVCQRQECRRFFLYQRPKQIYCSETCAQRVRMERFLAQRASSSEKR